MTDAAQHRSGGAQGVSPAVRFDRVSKRFGPLAVLDDVSFEIPQGKAFCLLG